MSRPDVVVVKNRDGDWTGLYIDQKLVYECHNLTVSMFVKMLKSNGVDVAFDFEGRPTSREEEQVVRDTARMPARERP